MTSNESLNPYAPPDVDAQSETPVLNSDTEFLFNDQVIAGAGTIRLPAVCICSGATDGLRLFEKTLTWVSPVLLLLQRVLIAASIVSFGIKRNGNERIPELICGLICSTVAMFAWTRAARQTVMVRWWVAEKALRRRRWVLAVLGVSFVLCAVLTSGMAWTLLIFFPLAYYWARRTRPSVVGVRNGMFYLGGFGSEFLRHVRRLAGNG